MYSDCVEFCTKHRESLVVILISGDVDFLSLIHKLVSQGHDVRLICQNKLKIQTILHRIVPRIIDRREILTTCKKLQRTLSSLSIINNFLLSQNPTESLQINEFVKNNEEIQQSRRQSRIINRINLLFDLPTYNWQYQRTPEGALKFSDAHLNESFEGVMDRRKFILLRLSYEANANSWEKLWEEFQFLYPNVSDQEKLVKKLYITIQIPEIRSRLQLKLIQIVPDLIEQEKNEQHIDSLVSRIQGELNQTCKVCSQTFSSQQALDQHIVAKQKSKLVKAVECAICKTSFVNQQALQQHQKAKHSESAPEEYMCYPCKKNFPNDLALLQHQQMKHGTKIKTTKKFACPSCNQKFQTKAGLSHHISKKH